MWHWFYKFSKGKPAHENMYESPFNLHSQLMVRFLPSWPKFQPRVNVVSELKFSIKMTLIQRWKWNKIRRRIFNFAQRWHNVEATLLQLSIDVVSTQSQRCLSYIKTNRAIVKYRSVNRLISFFLLYEKAFYAI